MGHPDKIADQVSDTILDVLIAKDPDARVACETLVTTGLVVLAGEVTVHNHAAETMSWINLSSAQRLTASMCSGFSMP